MTRRFRRILQIRRAAALALAVSAVAAPAALARPIEPVGPVVRDSGAVVRDDSRVVAGDSVGDRVRPAVRNTALTVAGDPVGDRARSGSAPVVVASPPLAQADGFDWLDAGVGAAALAALLLVGGTAVATRTRRRPLGSA